ncbi:hypothetical protein [Nonomuraea turkmeniaca]|uniref:hypothetical protein n=1 Tax=Nonomuraea turkmeniaca TaxID=103838 RepID=UPI001B880F71|nr:hypothetical protein [Nonomuraea turkmeniaca]
MKAAAGVVGVLAAWRLWRWGWPRLIAYAPENILTILAAGIATGVSAQGMWRFSEDVLGLDGPLRLLLFAFIEIAIITSAVRARRNMRENYSAGIDGIAVWALTVLTAVLSAMDARSLPEAVFRLAAPLVAAWLWERGMAIERHRIRGTGRINWRLTPERVMVWLRLAETTDRTAGEVDAQRRLTRLALAAKRARELRDVGAPERNRRAALARLDKAFESAAEHTGLGRDSVMQERVRAEVAALYSAGSLMDVTPDSAWVAPVEEPFSRLADETERLNVILADQHEAKSTIANLAMLAADATRQHLVPVTGRVTPSVITGRVTSPVTNGSVVPPGAVPVAPLPVTPGVTSPVTRPEVTPELTFEVTDPGVFNLERMLANDPYVTPLVTFDVTSGVTDGEVTEDADEASKTQVMRDHWDAEVAEDRYPTPKELAAHAGVHPSLASRKRREWVAELPWWKRRKADPKKVNA